MLNLFTKLFDTRSGPEKTIDAPVSEADLYNDSDTLLNRRAIPALIAEHIDRRRVLRPEFRYSTICIEHRLKANHPTVADSINMYDWTPYSHGPNSEQLQADLCRMSSTDWEDNAVLGVKKNWTFGGDFKPAFYPIDTTTEYLETWFDASTVDRQTVEGVVRDALSEFTTTSGTFIMEIPREEAVDLDQTFQAASTLY